MQVCRRRFQVHTTPITPASHPSHCLNFFGGCAATSPSLRSLNLCLSLGDDSSGDDSRGHDKGPCDSIGAILKRHASTSFVAAIIKRRRRETGSLTDRLRLAEAAEARDSRTLEAGGLTRQRELQSDYWTIPNHTESFKLTRSLSKTSSCRVADGRSR